MRDEENVFDPHTCPSGSEKRAEQVYVDRIKKAARIAMVERIIRLSSLTVTVIFVPSSYIDLMYLYVDFLSKR